MNKESPAEQLAFAHKVFERSPQSLLALIHAISVYAEDSDEKQALMTAVQDKLQQLEDTGALLDEFPALAKVLFNLRRAELQAVLPDTVCVLIRPTYAAFRTIKKLRGVVHDDETTNPAAVNNHLDKAACDRFFSNARDMTLALGPPLVAPPLPPVNPKIWQPDQQTKLHEYEEQIAHLRQQAELAKQSLADIEAAHAKRLAEQEEELAQLKAERVAELAAPAPVERACPVVQEETLPEDTMEPEQPAETKVTVNPDHDAWWQSSAFWATIGAGALTAGGVLAVVLLGAKKARR
ncbi:hypothetical protein J8273_1693 [Carpediemonas membranifera]|uniref:Uncharacterized protein n=1 Tax=Carpediemonas membranifera TaxID=201153 RepID=A0A8J6B1W7_9EUKA|nr:hypothetical protein J8273_1693 [Carpediemonas membranifera]|eukprot:KAG9396675.1 hypothetical protein J8273_1693 [Carpediemonas membranifera]